MEMLVLGGTRFVNIVYFPNVYNFYIIFRVHIEVLWATMIFFLTREYDFFLPFLFSTFL